MYKHIAVEKKDAYYHIILKEPKKANGLDLAMSQELLDAMEGVYEDQDVRALLVTGEGKLFSGGGDLGSMKAMIDGQDFATMETLVETVGKISMAIKELPIPVIFAVHGAVAGASFNLALAADFCIAQEDTKFIQSFVQVGLAPDGGGLFLLARSVGMNRAIQWAMTGEPITAETGKELGFIYDVCPEGALLDHAQDLIEKLVASPKQSFAYMKELLWAAILKDWKDYAVLEASANKKLSETSDFKEGVYAFLEKRKPKFE